MISGGDDNQQLNTLIDIQNVSRSKRALSVLFVFINVLGLRFPTIILAWLRSIYFTLYFNFISIEDLLRLVPNVSPSINTAPPWSV